VIDRAPSTESPRAVPHDLEAEASVLAAVLYNNRIVPDLALAVRPEHFYRTANRLIFEAALALDDRGESIDTLTLADELSKRQALDKAGGIEAIARLPLYMPSASNWAEYARIVVEHAKRRAIIELGDQLQREAHAVLDANDIEAFLDSADQRLAALRSFGVLAQPDLPFRDILLDAFQTIDELHRNRGKPNGVPSGFIDLDRLVGGFKKGELTIVAGRPSMGKSSLSTNVAVHAALEHGKSVAIFSLETMPRQVAINMISSSTPADSYKIRNGEVPLDTWRDFGLVGERLSPLKIRMPRCSGLDVAALRARCRRYKASPDGLDCVVVDYIQLIRPPRDIEPNRQQQVAAISRSLKELATELDVAVVALSQLNRATDGRAERRPSMSDIRESGAIEQDADLILLLFREDYYDAETEKKGIAEVIVAKHRNGPTGTVKLAWQPQFLRFANLAVPLP